MLRLSLIVTAFIFLPVVSFCQQLPLGLEEKLKKIEEGDSLIIWKPGKLLKVEDFQGKPDYSSKGGAASYIDIITIYNTDTPYHFYAISVFDKKKSWIKNSINAYSMNHEQKHFDIGEIFARKMQIELDNIKTIKKTIEWEVYEITINTLKSHDVFQNNYDKETKNSRDSLQQMKWNKKIEKTLKIDEQSIGH